MQRQFGKLWNKGPGDNAKVSALLNDYEDVDRLLAKVCTHSSTAQLGAASLTWTRADHR
jgi:hypothetical protein